jgi:hypothetical protein
MKPQFLIAIALAAVVAALARSPLASAQTLTLEAQKNDEGAVSVSVTPQDVSKTGDAWRFDVRFNTHVTPITQDMVAVASLSGGGDAAEPPTAWEGDPPGGHHRHGVLVFKPLEPTPTTLTLRIREVGGVAERTFTWNLGGS